jgi:CRP/FNR family transcriptional regulator, cyclic AMP receptor protein
MKAVESSKEYRPELIFAQAQLFRHMSWEVLRALMLACEIKALDEGEFVFDEGQDGSALYVVVKGRVEIIKGAGQPGAAVLGSLGESQFFGEMALLGNVVRSAGVKATEASEVAEVSRAVFKKLAVYYPDQYVILMKNLALDLAGRLKKLDVKFASRAA